MYGASRGSRWRGGHIGCGSRSLGSGGRSRVESRLVRVMRSGRRLYRFFRGAFLYAERVRADAAFANLALDGGNVRVGLVIGRGNVSFVGDENVVLLIMHGVRQRDGGGRRLGLGSLYAPLHLVEGYSQHFSLGFGGDGVPERGERTHVCGWGSKRGGDRAAGALVPGAVTSWMSGRPEEKWGRGGGRHRIRSSRG